MSSTKSTLSLNIWGLAFGYFFFYIPYSALTKALSKGLLPGTVGPVSGFELLPATALATTLTLPVFITLAGWWRFVPNRKHLLGIPFPVPRWQTMVSGLATAVIIATTTLNYTFVGISIVFALLLMRGGVLIMSPVIDLFFGRKVHWYSWAALALGFLAISVAFAEVGGYQMTLIAVINVGAYLTGYVFRLHFMTRIAKSERPAENTRYFVEETFVAAMALTLAPALLALIGQGSMMMELRTGFTTFLTSTLVLPALLIGFLYACLYMFGSRIYLDARENTFCITLNRCSSLLSGVVASYALFFLLGLDPPTTQQLAAAGILVTAILFLGFPTWQGQRHRSDAAIPIVAQRVFLFVCKGNTSRSPIAQALCKAEIAAQLGIAPEALAAAGIEVLSAGVAAHAGAPMKPDGAGALAHLRVPVSTHTAQQVTPAMIQEADVIFCMAEEHRQMVLAQDRSAASKLHLLDPEADLEEPVGPAATLAFARRSRDLIRHRLEELAPVS